MRFEHMAAELERGGDYGTFREAFGFWGRQLVCHATLETSVKPVVVALGESQREEAVAKLEDLENMLTAEIGEDRILARTQRHLFSRMVASRVAEFDHFENEEAFVVSEVREQMSEAEQLNVAMRLLLDEEAENPRWIIDWVAEELTPPEQDLLSALESRFR